ncbi:MAG: hypothetical protein V1870_02220 [Candidatus Aenigmatarchaeota archaeon]
MFENYKSKLGLQLQKIQDIPIEHAVDTTVEFAIERGGGSYWQPAPVTCDKIKDNIRKLAQVFSRNINPDSFEHIVSLGDIGDGLFSFGTYIRDPNIVVYLCYREYPGIFGMRSGMEIYIGAYDSSEIDYDKIVKEGVECMIHVKGNFVYQVSDKPSAMSNTIKDLYEDLMKVD